MSLKRHYYCFLVMTWRVSCYGSACLSFTGCVFRCCFCCYLPWWYYKPIK